MDTTQYKSDVDAEDFSQQSEIIKTGEKKQIIIHFEEGILGFEDIKEYLLYQIDSCNIIWSLQAQASEIPSFVVIDPFAIFKNYNPVLTKTDLEYFGKIDMQNLCFLAISVIKADPKDSVVNLKAPLVIDVGTKRAKQIILDNSNYPVRCKLFEF